MAEARFIERPFDPETGDAIAGFYGWGAKKGRSRASCARTPTLPN
jgi:hypothetical protein